MIRLGFALLLCLACVASYGATLTKAWDRFVGGAAGTVSSCVDAVTAADGAMYVLSGFDDGSANGVDVRVTKYSRIGTVLWTHTLPDLADRDDKPMRILIAQGGSSLIYTAIRYTGPRNSELVVSRLDFATGNPVWTRQVADFEDAMGLVSISPGSVIVGGAQRGILGVTDAALVRVSASGEVTHQDRWNRYVTSPAYLRDLTEYGGVIYAALGTGSLGSTEAALGAWDTSLNKQWSRFLDLRPLRPVAVAVNSLGQPMLAAGSPSADSPPAVVAKFSPSGIQLWDSAFTYTGRGDIPVGLSTRGGSYYLLCISNYGTEARATIATWESSSYPNLLAAFDADGSTTAKSFLLSSKGPLVVGNRTFAAGEKQWYAARFYYAGFRHLNFVEGGSFEPIRVIAGYRGYLVVGQDVAPNLSKVGRATLLTLGLSPFSVTLAPSSTTGGKSVIATVTLDEPAPIGGIQLAVTSNHASAQVPSFVTVPAGKTSATFSIQTTPVPFDTSAVITVGTVAEAKSAVLTVLQPQVSALTFTPASGTKFYGGEPLTAKVTLTGPAPAGGINVQFVGAAKFGISASTPVPAGQSSVEVTGFAPLTAVAKGFSMTARTVKPLAGTVQVDAPIVAAVARPQFVRAGDSFPITVTMRGKSDVPYNIQYVASTAATIAKTFSVGANTLEVTTSIGSNPITLPHVTGNGFVRYLISTSNATVSLLQLGMAKLTITPSSAKKGTVVQHRIELDKTANVIGKIGVSGAGWQFTVDFVPGVKVRTVNQTVKPIVPDNYVIKLTQGVQIGTTTFTVLP